MNPDPASSELIVSSVVRGVLSSDLVAERIKKQLR
nr:MAG TPA: hypothetical protein [Caudoviricetes sp.]